jgi:hypothetical protein
MTGLGSRLTVTHALASVKKPLRQLVGPVSQKEYMAYFNHAQPPVYQNCNTLFRNGNITTLPL